MPRLEVRCCCQPQKLRGWIDVPEHRARPGQFINFVLRSAAPVYVAAASMPERRLEMVELQVATFWENGREWLALKSEELPVEMLRCIRGFIAAE